MDERKKIGFGCVGLSAQMSRKAALNLLNVAFDAGVTHYDTAPLYGKGYSEKILGEFFHKKRDKVTIATKFGLLGGTASDIPVWLALPLNYLAKKIKQQPVLNKNFQEPGLLPYRQIGLDYVRNSFEKSLRNLRTNHVDYFLLHEALPSFITDEAFEYLLGLQQKGSILKMGIAASYTNYSGLSNETICKWDILQYESSLMHASEPLLNMFPDKVHIHHSILSPLQYRAFKAENKEEIPGILLARAVNINPAGKILFSSSKAENIKKNLQILDKYSTCSRENLENILQHALC